MSKVTSKRQVTIPKAVATRHGIEPGDEIEFESAGDVIRVVIPTRQDSQPDLAERLCLFDEATDRQLERQRRMSSGDEPAASRGWTRDELYSRGTD